jgi:uncharacterized protein (DUF3084 family)
VGGGNLEMAGGRVMASKHEIQVLREQLSLVRCERDKAMQSLDKASEELRDARRAATYRKSLLDSLPAHRLWRLLGECIQQHRDGNDVLASECWAKVVAAWNEF